MTDETTSMAADNKTDGVVTDTVSIPAEDYAAYQAYKAAQANPFAMAPNVPGPATSTVPSLATLTEATGVVPDKLPIPAAQAPTPTDTDSLIRDLLDRIQHLELIQQQQQAAAGIPTNPVEAAVKNLHDHVVARANANPNLSSLQELANSVRTIYDVVKSGEPIADKAWETVKLDLADLTDLFHRHELGYLPELVRGVDRARLTAK